MSGEEKTEVMKESPGERKEFEDLYPERRGRKVPKASLYGLIEREHDPERVKCENNVDSCLKKSPLVKMMLSALTSAGCSVDPIRHISCDICSPGTEIQHLGGYDEIYNQVFICANNVSDEGLTGGVIFRNLMHAFDRCSRKVDFTNPEHLACMEIRKANQGHCTYFYHIMQKNTDLSLKKQHSTCVKNVAVDFLTKTKFLDSKTAEEAVDKVFDKCYADLEPIGRRSSVLQMDKITLEKAVTVLLTSDPKISDLINSMRSKGCLFAPSSRIAVEECTARVDGGYDHEHNQVVICSNKIKDFQTLNTVLKHELSHMNDFCTFKVNFANMDHLACSEIRAYLFDGRCSKYFFSSGIRDCVKNYAETSVKIIGEVNKETAHNRVNNVFNRCYNYSYLY